MVVDAMQDTLVDQHAQDFFQVKGDS
jgi:hypothetical protein